MTLHVDIIRNDWSAGRQKVVARAFVADEDVAVDSIEGAWEDVVKRPFPDRGDGGMIYPEKEPGLFLEKLHTAIAGSYLFATEEHEEEKCPFAEANAVTMYTTRA